jgi:hypothetical protein
VSGIADGKALAVYGGKVAGLSIATLPEPDVDMEAGQPVEFTAGTPWIAPAGGRLILKGTFNTNSAVPTTCIYATVNGEEVWAYSSITNMGTVQGRRDANDIHVSEGDEVIMNPYVAGITFTGTFRPYKPWRPVELGVEDGYLAWRHDGEGDGDWRQLAALDEIGGAGGGTVDDRGETAVTLADGNYGYSVNKILWSKTGNRVHFDMRIRIESVTSAGSGSIAILLPAELRPAPEASFWRVWYGAGRVGYAVSGEISGHWFIGDGNDALRFFNAATASRLQYSELQYGTDLGCSFDYGLL